MRNIALLGLGYWGKNILRNLVEMDVLHTAGDTNAQTVERWQQTYPNTRFTTSVEAILKNPEIVGVVLATPAVTHFEMVQMFLRAGKDVFVEKPLALTADHGESLVAQADGGRRILMVGHILQYHPAVHAMKHLLRSGVLGTLQYLYSNRLNIGKLRTEENILWSFAPHDISVMLSLTNEEPVNVQAFGGAYINRDVSDTTLTTLSFRNNVKGHIFVSWLHPFKEQKLVVVGSKAMAVFDDLSKEKLVLYRHSIEWQNGTMPVAKPADREIVSVGTEEPLRMELQQFVSSIASRQSPPSDGREGLRVLRVLAAADQSLTRNP